MENSVELQKQLDYPLPKQTSEVYEDVDWAEMASGVTLFKPIDG